MTHRNAPMTPTGRARIVSRIVNDHWTYRRTAEHYEVSTATVHRWVTRHRNHEPLEDHSSRPHHCPHQLTTRQEDKILAIRRNKKWGPHRIAPRVEVACSTVGRVLKRHGMPKLSRMDPATGELVRTPRPKRYEKKHPGELVHVDIKKLGKIPDGGGWRAHGRNSPQHRAAGRASGAAARAGGKPGRGFRYIHHALDDHSRVVYSEILDDERGATAAGFWRRAKDYFARLGVQVKAVLTDNGPCYYSKAFNQALGDGIKHRFTRPYRPQTNGKVERFNRILVEEWAYAKAYGSEAERAGAYQRFIDYYNCRRTHTSLGGKAPMSRVSNLPGNYITHTTGSIQRKHHDQERHDLLRNTPHCRGDLCPPTCCPRARWGRCSVDHHLPSHPWASIMRPQIVDADTGRELWTASQCARHCEVTSDTWRSYSARGQCPASVGKFGASRLWRADEVRE